MAKNSFVAEVTFKINIRTNTLFNLGGNYMIPVSRRILNPICHVVVPGSIDFEDLAVVFSAHVYRENKEHVYLSGKI